MPLSDLQFRFMEFAKGMPAIAMSKNLLMRELSAMKEGLGGTYPDSPSPTMGNIPLPLYHLAYSAFLDDIAVTLHGGYAELLIQLRATIHPRYSPGNIIREYKLSNAAPIIIKFDYNSVDRTLRWVQEGINTPDIISTWGVDADTVLSGTTIPEPKKENFITEVELPVLWTTANAFISLVVDSLPSYNLADLCPWLTLLEPARFDFGGNQIIVTASRAKLEIGSCSPTSVIVEPDPSFPYGNEIGTPDTLSRAEIAIYLPKTRIINFVAGNVQPAVLVNTGERGGLIKWQVIGSFGIKEFVADISGGIVNGNPFADGGLTVSGLLGLYTAIDFVGGARAWVNGPSGSKLGLASAGVIGNGSLSADINVRFNVGSGVLSADLVVKHADINPDFDVNTPFGWPLDEITGEILNIVASNEVKKITGHVTKLGQWDILEMPPWFSELLEDARPFPVIEGYQDVAGHFGIGVQKG